MINTVQQEYSARLAFYKTNSEDLPGAIGDAEEELARLNTSRASAKLLGDEFRPAYVAAREQQAIFLCLKAVEAELGDAPRERDSLLHQARLHKLYAQDTSKSLDLIEALAFSSDSTTC